MCTVRRFIYVSFETIIVYLMSTVALTFMYIYYCKRQSLNVQPNYCL